MCCFEWWMAEYIWMGLNFPNSFAALYLTKYTPVESGVYIFKLGSDEGAKFSIDGNVVIDDSYPHLYQVRNLGSARACEIIPCRETRGGFFSYFLLQCLPLDHPGGIRQRVPQRWAGVLADGGLLRVLGQSWAASRLSAPICISLFIAKHRRGY